MTTSLPASPPPAPVIPFQPIDLIYVSYQHWYIRYLSCSPLNQSK
jgi:hypothetical protein